MITEKVIEIIEPSLRAMGYNLVQVRLFEGGKRTLQIMAERIDDKSMTVDDCADISRNVSALLDVEDPIQGAYHLEISSPGIDRPLTKLDDFTRFNGYEIKLETKLPQDGRKRFKGRIAGVAGNDITLILEDGPNAVIPHDMVRSAKLLLTDELIKKVHDAQNNELTTNH